MNIITRIINRGRYVYMDPNDNSITVSKRLYDTICKDYSLPDDVYTCHRTDGRYQFIVNPYENALKDYAKDKDRATSQLQFNGKHKCIGFAPDIPTVAQMMYDYGMPDKVCKVSVTRKKEHGIIKYIFEPCKRKSF